MSELGLKLPDDLLAAEACETLATVYDPELGINLVDIGLVYKLEVKDGEARVDMTLTTPGCPMSDSMPEAVERALLAILGILCVGRRRVGAALGARDDVRLGEA